MYLINKNQQGVGMIEVIVALFILAVGLLGALAMQANSIKSNQQATYSTDAQILAQDMVERIQAYNDIDIATDDAEYHDLDLSVTNPGCAAAGCDKDARKQHDAFEWATALRQRLPAGTGKVAFDASAGVYAVAVFWDANQDGSLNVDSCTDDSRAGVQTCCATQNTCYLVEFML